MLPLMTVAVSRTPSRPINPWTTALYAGLFTAIAALIFVYTTGAPIVPALAGLLIGAAPVLAYQLVVGGLGSNWRPVIAGILGFILFVAALFVPSPAVGWVTPVLALLSMLILWPIFVGAMSPDHSVGRLFLSSLLGLILGIAIFFIVGLLMGQNPNAWVSPAGILFFAFWGGTVGVALVSGRARA